MTRCPTCHADIDLLAVAEDESLRELLGILAELPREVSRPLVAYVQLWHGRTRAPAYERQLRIAREALGLHPDTLVVGAAMSETVEAIRAKRASGADSRALRSHRYLASVVESVAARVQARGQQVQPAGDRRAPTSATGRALAALQDDPGD